MAAAGDSDQRSEMAATGDSALKLRDPGTVMRLERLGSFHQCRLSFMRILTRRMAAEAWQFTRPVFEISDKGVGHAVFTATGPERSYSLVAFAHDLPDHLRSDRVIATAWDATFALFDGVPTAEDIERLQHNVPLQEGGRVSERELTLSRANRSVRLWDYAVSELAAGRQPDPEKLNDVGYLMRTTAVYGSGKFGAADYSVIADRPEMQAPFQAEMLTVFLIRTFVRDLLSHMAQVRGRDNAAQLSPALARSLGIGNSTGLGMAPFIVNHPRLFSNWISARETAIARVRALETASPEEQTLFRDLFARASASVALWRSEHEVQVRRLDALKADIALIRARLSDNDLSGSNPWDELLTWSESALSTEGQEFLASLILEPYGHLTDDLSAALSDRSAGTGRIDGSMSVGKVRDLLEQTFGTLLQEDWADKANRARVWYVSEEKLEPRLGERFDEPLEPYEQPLAPARDAAAAHAALSACDDTLPVADFLTSAPEHREAIRRAQISATAPYSEIRDNTIAADMFPVDMLRVKLSFFGAVHFDPRSDRWLRISMFRGAPYAGELTADNADLWIYPEAAA